MTSNSKGLLIWNGFSEQFFHLPSTRQCRQQMTALKNSNTSMYVDFHHNSGWGMCINCSLKPRNPLKSNLVRKIRENNYFPSRSKLEVIRYSHPTTPCTRLSSQTTGIWHLSTGEKCYKWVLEIVNSMVIPIVRHPYFRFALNGGDQEFNGIHLL